MSWCKMCDEYVLRDRCHCTKFLIRDPDYEGDENQEIWARSETSACQKYAKERYFNDPCDAEDFEIEVILNDSKYLTVTARAEVEFDCHEKGDE